MSDDTETNALGVAPAKLRIPGDAVNKATADLKDNQRSAIRWLHGYAMQHNLNLPELSKLVRYDASTLHRVFWGKYNGNLEAVSKEILRFKQLEEKRQRGRKLDFIETSLSQRIWQSCRWALEFQRLVYIIGETQTGKTTNLKQYALDHNHGETTYMVVPTGGTMNQCLAELATVLRISPRNKTGELRRRIIDSFDDRMLLIVDEAHQCVLTERRLNFLEFVREIHDRTGCGVVISATQDLWDEIEAGRLSNLLRQSKRRRLMTVRLPNKPTTADLNTFAKAYGLKPATGEALKLQTKIIEKEALGMWLTLLRMAASMASTNGTRMTWDHVTEANLGLRYMETDSKEAA